jgi:hypothetical protein
MTKKTFLCTLMVRDGLVPANGKKIVADFEIEVEYWQDEYNVRHLAADKVDHKWKYEPNFRKTMNEHFAVPPGKTIWHYFAIGDSVEL